MFRIQYIYIPHIYNILYHALYNTISYRTSIEYRHTNIPIRIQYVVCLVYNTSMCRCDVCIRRL